MPTLYIGTREIPYTIEVRPKRRYLAIQVDHRQQLKVLVPPGYPHHVIEDFLQEKSRWILHHITTPQGRVAVPEKQFVDGEPFWVRGEKVPLVLMPGKGSEIQVTQEGGILWVHFPSHAAEPQATQIREALVNWYLRLATELLEARILYYRDLVGQGPTRLKISEYKSRWGYCRADGLIAFNWRIVQAPDLVLDYVVVHELTHLQHPHHQKAFWAAVETVMPNFRIQRQWLRAHGAELGAW